MPLKIGPAKIGIDILSPETSSLYTNSRLKIRAKFSYPDGSPVKGAYSKITLSNEKTIELSEKTDGIYEGEYFIDASDAGTLKAEIFVEDIDENFGSFEQEFFVKKRSFAGKIFAYIKESIRQFWWIFLTFLIIVLIIFKPILETKWATRKIRKLNSEQKRVESMQIYIEKRYYKESSINKEEFKKLMVKYKDRMVKIKENIKFYEKILNEKHLKKPLKK